MTLSNYGVLTLLLLTSGCSVVGPRSIPPPVEDRSTGRATDAVSMPAPDTRVTIHPIERSPMPVATPLPNSPAVVALLQSASEQQNSGNLDSAASTLERALRIEPGNARLWSQLGQVRLQQARWLQAEQMALKSNRLASGDVRLQGTNWRLIAAAREGNGDAAGSRDASRKAVEILQR